MDARKGKGFAEQATPFFIRVKMEFVLKLGKNKSAVPILVSYHSLVVKDARLRALLEAYAIGSLCPEHIGLGE